MSDSKDRLCRDCRYCKLTVKGSYIRFSCIRHSWPCHEKAVNCASFHDYSYPESHSIIQLAWDKIQAEATGKSLED